MAEQLRKLGELMFRLKWWSVAFWVVAQYSAFDLTGWVQYYQRNFYSWYKSTDSADSF